MFLYVEQDVNLAYQSCSGLKNFKIALKNVKNPGKSCFAVRKEWVKKFILHERGHKIQPFGFQPGHFWFLWKATQESASALFCL